MTDHLAILAKAGEPRVGMWSQPWATPPGTGLWTPHPSEHPEPHDGAAVFCADGQPFLLIGDDLVVGGDALPRAQELADLLNAQ